MKKTKNRAKNVQAKSLDKTSSENLAIKRWVAGAYVSAVCFSMSEWICRLGVIDPLRWLPAANIARWLLMLGCIFVVFIGVLVLTLAWFMRLHSPTPQPKKTLFFFIHGIFTVCASLAIIFFLATGQLFVALVLNNLTVWVKAPQEWRSARQEEDPKLRRIQLLKVPIRLLFSVLIIVALAFQSFPLAVILFVGQQIQFLAEIPMLKEQMRHKLTETKVPKP